MDFFFKSFIIHLDIDRPPNKYLDFLRFYLFYFEIFFFYSSLIDLQFLFFSSTIALIKKTPVLLNFIMKNFCLFFYLSILGFCFGFPSISTSLISGIISNLTTRSFPSINTQKSPNTNPIVVLPNEDQILGVASNNIEYFKGIPYAEPPLGDLRFKRPIPYKNSLDGFQAFNFSSSCINVSPFGFFSLSRKNFERLPQLLKMMTMNKIFRLSKNEEDCLALNIYRPPGTKPGAKYPVLVWIHGGAFQFGGSSFYPGDRFIRDSLKMKQPIIFVTINYRLGPWGFLGGKIIQEEGSSNAGLFDQRLAFQWISDNIESFGGDSERITAMGESAGAISIAHHMVSYGGDLSYNGKQLFHAAILQSGGAWSFDSVSSTKPEELFSKFVAGSGCQNATSETVMNCLRECKDSDLRFAQNFNRDPDPDFNRDSFNPFFGWSPRFDGDYILDNPAKLMLEGKVAKIPYITGNQEDEGTALTFLFDFTSSSQVNEFLPDLFSKTNQSDIENIINIYPEDLDRGGIRKNLNEIFPGFKRFAQMIGDFIFHIPRRIQLENTDESIPRFVFLSKFLNKIVPILGTPHSSELHWQFFLDGHPAPVYRRYFISFANHYNPNVNTGLHKWKPYTKDGKEILVIKHTSLTDGTDEFERDSKISHLVNNPELIMI